MKLHIGYHQHKHGDSMELFATPDEAEAARVSIASQSWDGFMNEDRPADDTAMADRYFERANEIGDEWYRIEEVDLPGVVVIPLEVANQINVNLESYLSDWDSGLSDGTYGEESRPDFETADKAHDALNEAIAAENQAINPAR